MAAGIAGESANALGVVIGVASAVATTIVALINSRNTRRDARDNLRRDIELAKSLADGTWAKRDLEKFIAWQIRTMAIRAYTGTTRVALTVNFVLVEGFLISKIVIAASASEQETMHEITMGVQVGSVSFLVFGFALVYESRYWHAWLDDRPFAPSLNRISRALKNGVGRIFKPQHLNDADAPNENQLPLF